MADNMIKFFKGLEANLPAAGTNGALYITTDEGAIYLGTGTGMKRLGDFVQVANVASLPEKAHESCLYYCVAENILAKWNGTEWKQINKQPTAEELKGLLGLGTLAYKSEVAEADLNADLKAKVNAASAAQHTHANKELLDTYTQTEANLADAVAKKHEHANAAELAKIVEGDKAKWDAVAADHLTSADKTTLENAIKEAKQAGTDANTALETYKVENNARVLAVEEDIAEITDAESGILAQAKGYSDGKLATARTEISAEIDADVKVVNDALEAYKTANDAAVAGVKATAEAAAVKTEVETALAGKVDKVEGKSLISDDEIARLATLKNYDDTALTGRVSVAEGKITALETASATHALKSEVEAVDAKFADYNTTVAQKAIDDAQDERIKAIEDTYLVEADIANFETKENVKKVADDLATYIESNDEALAGVKATAEAATTVSEVDAQIDAKIGALNLATTYEPVGAEDRAKAYVDQKFTDADLAQYTTEAEVKSIVDGVIAGAADSETYNSLTKLVDYIDAHGGEATEMAQAIETLEGKVETIEGKPAYGITATQISNWDNEVGAKAIAESKTTTAEVKEQIEAYGYATTGYADGKAADAQAAAIADAATKYETKGTVQGIVDGLKLSETYEPIGAEGRAVAAAKTETETQVSALAETLYTKSEVDALIEAAHSWGSF